MGVHRGGYGWLGSCWVCDCVTRRWPDLQESAIDLLAAPPANRTCSGGRLEVPRKVGTKKEKKKKRVKSEKSQATLSSVHLHLLRLSSYSRGSEEL